MLGWIVSEADTFELKKQVKCTWVWPHWWFCGSGMGGQARMLRWLARFLHGRGAGVVVNLRVFEEVFVGSQTRYYGGIFVRACMQNGTTAFDWAKIRGHEDIAVRDRV